MMIFDSNISVFTTSDNYWNINGLRPFSSYTFRVAASTIIGIGPFSTNVTVTTPEDGKHIIQRIIYEYRVVLRIQIFA